MTLLEPRASPHNRLLRDPVHGVGAGRDHRGVVVPAHHHRARVRVRGDDVQHGRGVGAVADQVADERKRLGSRGACVVEAGGERLQVRVDVGEDGELHRAAALPAEGWAGSLRESLSSSGPPGRHRRNNHVTAANTGSRTGPLQARYPKKLGIRTPPSSAMVFTMKLGPLPMYVPAP